MSALVRREATRWVTVTAEVTATVRLHRKVYDSDVRESLDMEEGEEVTVDEIDEYLRESEDIDDSEWDVVDFTDWGMKFDVEVDDETVEMVAPPAFVPLPGMDSI